MNADPSLAEVRANLTAGEITAIPASSAAGFAYGYILGRKPLSMRQAIPCAFFGTFVTTLAGVTVTHFESWARLTGRKPPIA
ncbi:unnamed protein product [Phaeothamnion confervicola]